MLVPSYSTICSAVELDLVDIVVVATAEVTVVVECGKGNKKAKVVVMLEKVRADQDKLELLEGFAADDWLKFVPIA